MIYKEIEDFIIDKCGFVDPEKVTAIDLYGLKKAKQLFANGGPNYNIRENLRIISLKKYLLGGGNDCINLLPLRPLRSKSAL